ncbi:MAG: ribosome silencing factor [Desulfomonile sp.]|nr:ribosome silencing factor [Desulfomonile sp.]
MNKATADLAEMTSKAKSEILLRAAMSKKALNPVLIRLTNLTTLADYFLIVSARSARQVSAVAEEVMKKGREHHFERLSAEGVKEGTWALLDYGDVVVHIFQRPVREFYDLEGLWIEAPREPLPSDLGQDTAPAEEDEEEEDW